MFVGVATGQLEVGEVEVVEEVFVDVEVVLHGKIEVEVVEGLPPVGGSFLKQSDLPPHVTLQLLAQ
jgi:hypothetical protein